ncbi:MAG TPA: D-serine ammonia-lyase [Clostridiales bacterium]|nr:D-serine ammonia-lyase [Clostridiales bacterium]
MITLVNESEALKKVKNREEILWINKDKNEKNDFKVEGLTPEDIDDAEDRLSRFSEYIMKAFPETKKDKGLIESPLREIPLMKNTLNKNYRSKLEGKLFLKMDSHLPIAGSVKARGGIYEILKHTEDLALEKGLIKKDDSYEKLRDPEVRDFFSQYSIHVGSTGNLGLSIGIISAEIGYKVTVHMSADAKEWKKDLLRNYGVEVVEYTEDYGKAVEEGRKKSLEDPNSYFVDDENSKTLFLGYSVAAKRLKKQIKEQNIMVDKDHPLFVYIPCGVGGAPGGISYGLKVVFKENVHCFFVEPTESPCMLIGMESGLNNKISVQDIGLTGITDADGLAVGRPSGFVGNVMKNLLSGIFTIKDFKLYDYLRDLMNSENIFLEPSACATFEGPANLLNYNNGIEYIKSINLNSKMENATHIVWATGGRLVPEDVRKEYLKTHIKNK